MNRYNWYYRQKVGEAEMDGLQANIEQAISNVVLDLFAVGWISGANLQPETGMSVQVTPGRGYDEQGQRIFIPSVQTIDMTPYQPTTSGMEAWVLVAGRFKRMYGDPRTDGHGNLVYFREDEGFEIVCRKGEEAPLGSATKPAKQAGDVIIGYVRVYYGQTSIAGGDVSAAEREQMGAHPASEITVADAGNKLAASNVEDALQELATGIDTLAALTVKPLRWHVPSSHDSRIVPLLAMATTLAPGFAPDASNSASATRSAMGADLTGTDKWAGGVLAPNGFIYGIPYGATDILVINPFAGNASRNTMGSNLEGNGKWYGGVLGPDGKIYGIPYNATDILIIDPAAGTATRSTLGADLSGSAKWLGGVLGPDGKIYGIPHYAADILIIDPAAGTATRSTLGAGLTGSAKWLGGVFGPDGKIYGIPYNATDILIIDPASGTATRSTLGASLSGWDKWLGGVLGPDGKIYGIPSSPSDILVIDPLSGTASRDSLGADLSGSFKWYGRVLGPDGKIYGIPYNATDILIIDPKAGKLSRDLVLSGFLNKW